MSRRRNPVTVEGFLLGALVGAGATYGIITFLALNQASSLSSQLSSGTGTAGLPRLLAAKAPA
jgi:hypothetical protein